MIHPDNKTMTYEFKVITSETEAFVETIFAGEVAQYWGKI